MEFEKTKIFKKKTARSVRLTLECIRFSNSHKGLVMLQDNLRGIICCALEWRAFDMLGSTHDLYLIVARSVRGVFCQQIAVLLLVAFNRYCPILWARNQYIKILRWKTQGLNHKGGWFIHPGLMKTKASSCNCVPRGWVTHRYFKWPTCDRINQEIRTDVPLLQI